MGMHARPRRRALGPHAGVRLRLHAASVGSGTLPCTAARVPPRTIGGVQQQPRKAGQRVAGDRGACCCRLPDPAEPQGHRLVGAVTQAHQAPDQMECGARLRRVRRQGDGHYEGQGEHLSLLHDRLRPVVRVGLRKWALAALFLAQIGGPQNAADRGEFTTCASFLSHPQELMVS